jgi:hypothetical protein
MQSPLQLFHLALPPEHMTTDLAEPARLLSIQLFHWSRPWLQAFYADQSNVKRPALGLWPHLIDGTDVAAALLPMALPFSKFCQWQTWTGWAVGRPA